MGKSVVIDAFNPIKFAIVLARFGVNGAFLAFCLFRTACWATFVFNARMECL